jgi:hypothetical protein
MAIKHWEHAKAAMNKWDDLLVISRGTEKQFAYQIPLHQKSVPFGST